MTFTVTYRAKDGALSEETVEAADRAACVAACRARGIAPVSVREGKIRTGVARPPRPCRKGEGALATSRKVALVAALVIVAVGVGVWWWLAARGGRADAREERGGKSAVSPKPAAKRPEPVAKRPEPAATNAPAAVRVAEVRTAPSCRPGKRWYRIRPAPWIP